MTVKHIRIHRRRTQHERSRPEDLPAGLRDPEVVRAKTLGRAPADRFIAEAGRYPGFELIGLRRSPS